MDAIGRGKGNNTKIHVAKTWIFLVPTARSDGETSFWGRFRHLING